MLSTKNVRRISKVYLKFSVYVKSVNIGSIQKVVNRSRVKIYSYSEQTLTNSQLFGQFLQSLVVKPSLRCLKMCAIL